MIGHGVCFVHGRKERGARLVSKLVGLDNSENKGANQERHGVT